MLLTVTEFADLHDTNRWNILTAIRSGKLKTAGQRGGKYYIDSEEPYVHRAKRRRGITHDPAYCTWSTMKARCENKKYKSYRWYGAKGVKVCEEWQDPDVFFDWLYTHGWSKGLTIDRIDSNGDYCPDNCQIITRSENSKKAAKTPRAPRPLEGYQIGKVETIEDLLSGNAAALSRITGYPHSTILQWQHKPTSIPLDAAIKIANDIDLSAEEWANIYRNTLKSAPRSAGS